MDTEKQIKSWSSFMNENEVKVDEALENLISKIPSLLDTIYSHPGLASIFGGGIGLGLEALQDKDKRNYLRGFILGSLTGGALSLATNMEAIKNYVENPYIRVGVQAAAPLLLKKFLF